MAVTASSAPIVAPAAVATTPSGFRYLEWGPVILGALGATAISAVLLTFGAALGLTVISPYPYAGLSAKGVAVLAATYAALVAVASFAAGGYLAGRLRTPWASGETVEESFRDGAHGFGVWALGVLLGAALAASGAGAILKTAAQTTTAVAAAGTAGAASNPAAGAALERIATGPTDHAVDRLLAPGPATAAPTAGTAPEGDRVPRAELAAPMARTFATALRTGSLDARDRTYLARLVAQQTGMPQADAEKRVDEAYAELKAAEQKARDTAEQARRVSLIAAFLAAATLAIGCAAACAGAALGARHRDEATLVAFFGSRRFW